MLSFNSENQRVHELHNGRRLFIFNFMRTFSSHLNVNTVYFDVSC